MKPRHIFALLSIYLEAEYTPPYEVLEELEEFGCILQNAITVHGAQVLEKIGKVASDST